MKFVKWAALLVILISINYPLRAQANKSIFRDSVDNAFDISTWLLELHGIVPIISPITEPAVGYGAVGAGAYFIAKKENLGKEFRMPDIIGLAGGLTENGTWLAGGGCRYLLARQLGLQMEMDVGWGPDSWAFYIIFGSAWLR